MPDETQQRSQMIKSLACYIKCAQFNEKNRDDCSSEEDYHTFLRPFVSNDTINIVSRLNRSINVEELVNLDEIKLLQDEYYSIVEQIYTQDRPISAISLPYSVQIPNSITRPRSFFEQYLTNAIKNDNKTRLAVNETMDRLNLILSQKDAFAQRVSGLVVGRVQSGKTRNYIGLMLKAMDEGWNVIIVLTSDNVALANQTRKRIYEDFTKSKIANGDHTELQFLNNQRLTIVPTDLERENNIHVFWGVAMKEKSNLKRVNQWFENNRYYAEKMRVLVIDDEADNATPDSRANTNNHLTEEELGNLYDTLADDENYNELAYWLLELEDKEFPDLPEREEEDNQEQKEYRKLRNFLGMTSTYKRALDELLNTASFRRLINVEGRDENGAFIYDHSEAIRQFFHEGRGERSPKHFICALNTVLEIASTRSTINKYICTFVDKAQESNEYAFPFQKCAYVAYTATPYACVLNEHPTQTALYPDFIRSLEKSPQYFGLEEIFGEDVQSTIPRMKIIRSISDTESKYVLHPIQKIKDVYPTNENQRPKPIQLNVTIDNHLNYQCSNGETGAWQTMKDAIVWAFCTAAARRYYRNEIYKAILDRNEELSPEERESKFNDIEYRWTTMLVNISHKKDTHTDLCNYIKSYLNTRCSNDNAIQAFILECEQIWNRETGTRMGFTINNFDALFNNPSTAEEDRYGEIDNYPSWTRILPHLIFFMRGYNDSNVHTVVINSKDRKQQETYTQDPEKVRNHEITEYTDDNLWIVCGGNTISRGLTLAGLTVSYFDRIRKTIAVDTMTQMGRWFGYRKSYELLPRLWMLPQTVIEMKKTAVIEDRMHASMAYNFTEGFSPSDPNHYQIIYSFGRILSGRAKAQKKLTESLGTFGTTSQFSTKVENIDSAYELASRFVREKLITPFERNPAEYYYSYVPCWKGIPKQAIVEFIEQIKGFYPIHSKVILDSLLKDIREDFDVSEWDVVIGTPRGRTVEESEDNGRNYSLGGNDYPSGQPKNMMPDGENAVKFSGSARLYTSYYAMIPTYDLNAVDVENLTHNYNEIVDIISDMTKENNNVLPASIEQALPKIDNDAASWKERFNALVEQLKADNTKIIPRGIHGLFRKLNNGYKDRSSAEYMERVHNHAGHTNPTLQLYLITPPEGLLVTDKPFVSLAFYWPEHESDGFHANCVGLAIEQKTPSDRQFYKAVEEELTQYNFPMPASMLMSNVTRRLSCNDGFFSRTIRKEIEKRNYAVFEGRHAYYLKSWSQNPEERLRRELLRVAIEFLQEYRQPVKRNDLLEEVLQRYTKFKGFFNGRKKEDQTILSDLMTDDVLRESHIEVCSQRPFTYRFNGEI